MAHSAPALDCCKRYGSGDGRRRRVGRAADCAAYCCVSRYGCASHRMGILTASRCNVLPRCTATGGRSGLARRGSVDGIVADVDVRGLAWVAFLHDGARRWPCGGCAWPSLFGCSRSFGIRLSISTFFPRGKKSEAAVGDCVSIERRARDQGVIIKILPRRAWLCRSDRFKSRIFASNFDQLLFVLAAVPRVSEMLLGRALVAAHAHRVRALIVLNKTDLEAAARVARARLDLYRSLGYTALEISAKTQPEAARSQLEIRLKHQITLLLGPSGTGKSTLVNLLAPGAQAKTQEISTALRTGKHTTAFTRLYPLKNGGALIDSPGFQNFGLYHVSEKVFAQAFTEFQPFVSQCRFSDCRHLHEPECAVRTAVVARKIDTQRYALYAQLLREAQLTRF